MSSIISRELLDKQIKNFKMIKIKNFQLIKLTNFKMIKIQHI